MNTTRIPSPVYYILLLLVIIFSFCNFAEINYPLLNSDMSVNILMAKGISLPGDLYFWGQDRGGSLIPVLANILVEAYKFPPVLAVSIVHYLILIAGFFAIAGLLKNRNLKLILALVWFFPSLNFIDHLTTLFGIQMSMMAIGLYLLRKMLLSVNEVLNIVWLSLACLSFIISVWVSDLAVLSLIIISGIVAWKYSPMLHRKRYLFFLRDRKALMQTGTLLLWCLFGLIFILYAKHKAVNTPAYHTHHFNSISEIAGSITTLFTNIWKILLPKDGNVAQSLYSWALLAGVPVVLYLSNTRSKFMNFCSRHKWLVFFTLNGLLTLCFLIISHWVFINGNPMRYFTVVYISFWIALLLYIEVTGSENRQARMIVLLIIAITGAVSTFSNFYFPHRLPSRVSALEQLSSLGNFGMISAYEYAYSTAAIDPTHIVATPNDSSNVRNFYLAESVFRMPKFYLAKNHWMKEFPDTLIQFGHIIKKKGNEFSVAGLDLCEYERVFYERKFMFGEMQHQGKEVADPFAESGKSIVIGKGYDRNKHFVFGPFLSLKQGTLLVRYHLRSDPGFDTRNMALLEVSAEYGKKILTTKALRQCDFQRRDSYQYFDLKSTLDKDYEGVEFRIMYLGGPDLYFDRIELTGM